MAYDVVAAGYLAWRLARAEAASTRFPTTTLPEASL
jgi:hypothetical protein